MAEVGATLISSVEKTGSRFELIEACSPQESPNLQASVPLTRIVQETAGAVLDRPRESHSSLSPSVDAVPPLHADGLRTITVLTGERSPASTPLSTPPMPILSSQPSRVPSLGAGPIDMAPASTPNPSLGGASLQEPSHSAPSESPEWTQPLQEVYMCVMRVLENIIEKIRDGIESASELPRALFDRIKVRLEEFKPLAREAAERICLIVYPIFQVLVSAVLFASQSTLFTIGFLMGILNPGAIQKATGRICDVWNRQHGIAPGLIVAGAVVAWPITLAASAFFVGGNIGVFCQDSEAEQPVGVV